MNKNKFLRTVRQNLLLLVLIGIVIVGAGAGTGTSAGAGAEARDDGRVIYVLKISGTITEGTAVHVIGGLREADKRDAEAILIIIDTPGGIVAPTLEMTREILASDVPVITFVAPKGAIAASAGSFILISGNIAAMAPGTTTGAAMPVEIGPEGRRAADDKIIKFLAGHMESIAAVRDRNTTQAKRFVTHNDVLGPNAALEHGIIDLVSEDTDELLMAVDGMTVMINGLNVTLRTKDAPLYIWEKTIRCRLLDTLGDPTIASILLMIGIYGLIFGFMSGGTYVPEMIGAICLILALFGLGLIDVNIFGVILILIAVLLFVAELITPTFGVLTTGGVVCLIIGVLLLPKEPLLFSPVLFKNFLLLVIGVGIASAVFFLFAMATILKTRKQRAKVGIESLIGNVAKAETEINEEEGIIKMRGEFWKAVTPEGEEIIISKGEKVEIIDVEGLTLIVKPKERVK